jgi:hypothetical protein
MFEAGIGNLRSRQSKGTASPRVRRMRRQMCRSGHVSLVGRLQGNWLAWLLWGRAEDCCEVEVEVSLATSSEKHFTRESASRPHPIATPNLLCQNSIYETLHALGRNPQPPPSIQLEASNIVSIAIVLFHHADRQQTTEAVNGAQERLVLANQISRDRRVH